MVKTGCKPCLAWMSSYQWLLPFCRTQSKKIITSDSFCDLKCSILNLEAFRDVSSGRDPWCADCFALRTLGGQQVQKKKLFSETLERWNQGHFCHHQREQLWLLPKTLPRSSLFPSRKRVQVGRSVNLTSDSSHSAFPISSPLPQMVHNSALLDMCLDGTSGHRLWKFNQEWTLHNSWEILPPLGGAFQWCSSLKSPTDTPVGDPSPPVRKLGAGKHRELFSDSTWSGLGTPLSANTAWAAWGPYLQVLHNHTPLQTMEYISPLIMNIKFETEYSVQLRK